MIAFIGFLVATVAVALFAYSFAKTYHEAQTGYGRAFVIAFGLLSAAMAACAVGAWYGDQDVLAKFVYVADVLLIAGTVAILYAWIQFSHPLVIVLIASVSALVLALRAYTIPPQPFMDGGLLHFNNEGDARTVLLGMITIIWLPAAIAVISRVIQHYHLGVLGNLLRIDYALLVAVTVLFFAARQNILIASTFAAMIALFFSLALINMYIGRILKKLGHGVSHAKR